MSDGLEDINSTRHISPAIQSIYFIKGQHCFKDPKWKWITCYSNYLFLIKNTSFNTFSSCKLYYITYTQHSAYFFSFIFSGKKNHQQIGKKELQQPPCMEFKREHSYYKEYQTAGHIQMIMQANRIIFQTKHDASNQSEERTFFL